MLTKINQSLPILCFFLLFSQPGHSATYPIVDSGQTWCYDNNGQSIAVDDNLSFDGQDAQYNGNQPSYTNNGDGTISDNVTGLMWQQDPGNKKTFSQAVSGISTFNLAGYSDWRLPTIKELYSLINFDGETSTDETNAKPYINTNYFVFHYGDTATERYIDAQYWSANEYVSTTMSGDDTVFGVNFADGRIKGYPKLDPMSSSDKTMYVMYVRGNASYGINSFVDNSDNTISDQATDLMWMKEDSGILLAGPQGNGSMNWEQALLWAENLTYGGYSDWRLPNTKELQSIVDYTRSPDTTGSAALHPLFTITSYVDGNGLTNYPYFWSSTTHLDGANPGDFAAYQTFGEALGYMEQPPGSSNYTLLDVHGTGAQRSDPKSGDPTDYPNGHGPQGDVIGIYNYVRCVRGGEAVKSACAAAPTPTVTIDFNNNELIAYPNPSTDSVTIAISNTTADQVKIDFYNIHGTRVSSLTQSNPGMSVQWNATDVAPGIYLAKVTLTTNGESQTLPVTKIAIIK